MASRAAAPQVTLPTHVSRVQSPSSINTFKQCPRKYYYHYIEQLPTKHSIHLLRGNITHTALDKFFDTNVVNVPDGEEFFFTMKVVLNETFRKEWQRARPELESLGLTKEELLGYYDETKLMVNNYFDYFTDKMHYFTRFLPVKEAWEAVKPSREVEFCSEEHCVRGFMDAIHDENGKTLILDYKTSRKAHITPEYELQLSIYALLYQEKFRMPDMVGIFFLKEGKECLLDVTPQMVERAKQEIMDVHLGTKSSDVQDYPKRPSPLCRWATGACDFYDECWEKRD
jgi:ATP-dependent exoDNAse (exonuclease V) beta subunit